MELFPSNIKKLFIFQEAELSHILQETETLKTSYISGSNFSSSKNKKKSTRENFLYFRKQKSQKYFLYFLKRKLFLYFTKRKLRKKLFIFQETEPSYISGSIFLSP